MSTKLRLSWAGDHNSLKEFVENTLELQGNWSSPAGEKKLFVANNVVISWWKNKKFITIDGDDANRIKRGMINVLLSSSNSDYAKTKVDIATNTENSFNENHSARHQCASCVCTTLSPEVEGLKLDFVVLEANLNHKIQAMEKQILNYSQNSKYAVSNENSLKRADLSSSLDVQPIDNPLENSCIIINSNVNNMTPHKENPQRDDASVECQSKNPYEESFSIVNTNANFDAKENTFDDVCSVVNTDANEDMGVMRSRLKHKNELLQEVEVLRDENELLRDTMEVLTHELEKQRAYSTACDFSKIKENITLPQGSKQNIHQCNQQIPTRITHRKYQSYPRRRSNGKRNDLNNQNDLIRQNNQNISRKRNDYAAKPRDRREVEEGFRTGRRWRDKMKFYQFFY